MDSYAPLRLDAFTAYIGNEFTIETDGDSPLGIELTEVKPLPVPPVPELNQEPFSLIFKGPTEPLIEPSTYELSHQNGSKYLLHLQAVMGSGPEGIFYEAIIN